MFTHVVFFWLKNGLADERRQAMLADAPQLLGNIPGVRHVWAGRPAMTPRDIVDNSYQVGLCVILNDAAAHEQYQAHPLHRQFIERHGAAWQRVQVYDFM